MTRHHRHAPLPSLRMGRTWRWSLYLTVALLTLSGAAWLMLHFSHGEQDLPSPLEPWALRLHGAAAFASLYLAGTLLHGHMLRAWQLRRNRTAGLLAASTFTLLVITGYGLYYFGGAALRHWTDWLHWVAGASLPIAIAWHVHRGRAAARALVRAALGS